MAAWLIPALKMVLPHIGTILSVATPVFTKKKADTSSDPTLQQQIDELQSAASLSANQIKERRHERGHARLAAAVEQVASVAESKLKTMMILCVTATVISFCLVLFLLLNQ